MRLFLSSHGAQWRLGNIAAFCQWSPHYRAWIPILASHMTRRALAIDEQSYGTEHPNVAIGLNNLAALLKATNRLAEAEPLMRRHAEIFVKFTAATRHPHLQAGLGNYAVLLPAMCLVIATTLPPCRSREFRPDSRHITMRTSVTVRRAACRCRWVSRCAPFSS